LRYSWRPVRQRRVQLNPHLRIIQQKAVSSLDRPTPSTVAAIDRRAIPANLPDQFPGQSEAAVVSQTPKTLREEAAAWACAGLTLLALLAVTNCGCSVWRALKESKPAHAPRTQSESLGGWMSSVSTNNLNLTNQAYDMRTDEQILGIDPSFNR
jgi:hypothetical protein